MTTTAQLSNINFMSRAQYEALDTLEANQLYQLECDVVIESYVNGTEWYRKYASGWVEQGGKVELATSPATVTLLIPFANVNYTITAGFGLNTALFSSTSNSIPLSGKLGTGFRVYGTASANNKSTWYACGQGA